MISWQSLNVVLYALQHIYCSCRKFIIIFVPTKGANYETFNIKTWRFSCKKLRNFNYFKLIQGLYKTCSCLHKEIDVWHVF